MPRLLPKTAANRGPRGLCASMRARRAGLVVAACLSILPAAPVAAETPAASPQQQGRPLESTESVYRHVLKMTGLDARRPNQDEFIGAVSDAVRSHPSSRGNLLNRDIAEQGIKAARSDLFPSVNIGLESVGSSFGRVGKHQYSDFAVRPDAFLTVQQLIYDGGAVYKRIAAARYNATAVQATTAAQTHSFALQTISVYYDVVRLRAIVEMARENVRRYEELYGQVRERAEGGLIPPQRHAAGGKPLGRRPGASDRVPGSIPAGGGQFRGTVRTPARKRRVAGDQHPGADLAGRGDGPGLRTKPHPGRQTVRHRHIAGRIRRAARQ